MDEETERERWREKGDSCVKRRKGNDENNAVAIYNSLTRNVIEMCIFRRK